MIYQIRSLTKIIAGSLWGSVADLREVVSLAKRGSLKYRESVTKRGRLEEIKGAFNTMCRGQYTGRTIISLSTNRRKKSKN